MRNPPESIPRLSPANNRSREVTAFLPNGKKSDVVPFSPGTEALKQCRDFGLSCEPIPLRLIHVQLKGGETEVLATSLLDEGTHPRAWFNRLYHLRWGVDKGYKREKSRLKIENVSGLSAQIVQQDFYAKIFVLNLSAVLSRVAQAIADGCTHNAHMIYVLLAPGIDRQEVLEKLRQQEIWPVFHYVPLHSSPAGKRYGRTHGALDVTDSASEHLIRLPLWVGLTSAQQERGLSALRSAAEQTSVRSAN